ncbi:Dynein heavy chain axonemal [Fasciola hepatica]|uniref:Dynein heavy chain axonemal n=1 Tax=Fasciola hepatica TaxID=6192 RepID=A0A4E0RWT6_FASHE|nr:Dynein heavy chain axonemal [Fasciola hepatica]
MPSRKRKASSTNGPEEPQEYFERLWPLKRYDDIIKRLPTPTFSCSSTKTLPALPPVVKPEAPSSLYVMVSRNAKHPPLMNPFTLTKASPFKEQKHWRPPSQSIGNNFSPAAVDIQLDMLARFNNIGQTPRGKEICKDEPGEGHISRPMSPEQQLVEMKALEAERQATRGRPSERDLERYYYYIDKGISDDMIAPPPDQLWKKLEEYTPKKLVVAWPYLAEELREEIRHDFDHALRKSIVDYILLDPEERKRLFIEWTPVPHPSYVVRAPVPWNAKRRKAFEFCQQSLFAPCALTLAIQHIWCTEFSQLRFVQVEKLRELSEPVEPSAFENLITTQCSQTRELLRTNWIPKCARAFIDLRHTWTHLLPQKSSDSIEAVRAFFACIAALMSKQLRSIVDQSLKDLLELLQEHNDGNAFEDVYDELKFLRRPLLLIRLRVSDPKIVFTPTFRDTRDCILRCFQAITDAADGLPRVEVDVFPELRNQALFLRSVSFREQLVIEYTDKAMTVFRANSIGPKQYLEIYKPYGNLLNNKAELELRTFLKDRHTLLAVKKRKGKAWVTDQNLVEQLTSSLNTVQQKIEGFQDLRGEITMLRLNVPLSLFSVDCQSVNEELANRVWKLRDILISFELDENREVNRSICRRYDEIMNRLSETPPDTEKLVQLQAYMRDVSNTLVFKLKEEVAEAADRLNFLLDYAFLSGDDIKLNSTLFYWPEHILSVLDVTSTRVNMLREAAEEDLKNRTSTLEAKILTCWDRIALMRRREVVSQDEMVKSKQILDEFQTDVDTLSLEAEKVNREEALVQWEQTQFPQLAELRKQMDPFDRLWRTALDFDTLNRQWLQAPYHTLNPFDIEQQVSDMYKTAHKLTKTLAELAGPAKVAQKLKSRLVKFQQFLPIIHVVCNPGIQPRHWDQMSDIVGFDIKPSPDTQLITFLEYGLKNVLEQLEEVGAAAAKEHQLETTMAKMKEEWRQMRFELLPYRDTVSDSDQCVMWVTDTSVLCFITCMNMVYNARGTPRGPMDLLFTIDNRTIHFESVISPLLKEKERK